jgi:U32 family peptidase
VKLTSYAQSLFDLGVLKDSGVEEVILGHRTISRYSKTTDDELTRLIDRSRELGLRVLLEWDILMTGDVFESCLPVMKKFSSLVDAIRVQDPGALHWCIKETQLPLQFIAENGNHNIESLKGWCELSLGRLERIILSIELSRETITEYCQNLPVACEILGLGRILLFYTPRSLLGNLFPEKFSLNEELEVLGESEESPHKGFPILENRHGTFMFHIKEFCLLEYAKDLAENGLGFLRIDLRFSEVKLLSPISILVQDFNQEKFLEFKENYPQDLMRGFYLVNKTDVLFPKLKNVRLQKREGDFLGEVLEAEKGQHLAILVRNPRGIRVGDKLRILHPKGEEFQIEVRNLRNSGLKEVQEVASGSLALIPYLTGVWVRSQIFLA